MILALIVKPKSHSTFSRYDKTIT